MENLAGIKEFDFIRYLIENNEKARVFMIGLVLKNFYLKYADINYVLSNEFKDVIRDNGVDVDVVTHIIAYDLIIRNDYNRLDCGTVAFSVSEPLFYYSISVGPFRCGDHKQAILSLSIGHDITDGKNNEMIFSQSRNCFFAEVGKEIVDSNIDYVLDMSQCIQLDYFNEEIIKNDPTNDMYQFLYLLKYEKAYHVKNDIIDSIIDTYHQYLKSYS